MTQPNPDQGQQSGDGGGQQQQRKAPKVKVGDVVSFTREDPILRREHRGVGVVVTVDDQAVEVRPLANHAVRLAPTEVATISADEV